MSIDWFTFGAQVVNFLVLVWLLRRFLYKPVLNAIDERERSIAEKIQDAEKLREEATIQLDDYQRKNSEFDQHREALYETVRKEAESQRQKYLEDTRSEIEKLRFQLQEALRNEQQSLGEEIVQRARTEVFSVVRKTLRDLASVDLEEQMAYVFKERIKNLDVREKDVLSSAIRRDGGRIILRTTFGLSPEHQQGIAELLSEEYPGTIEVRAENASTLVSGIELIAGGYKLAWSIDDYLALLAKSLSENIPTGVPSGGVI